MVRLKARYNPKPTAQEKAFHLWLIESFPCACGCGQASTLVHHVLASHPAKRWRRDHAMVVPLHWTCHNALHAKGSETGKFAGMADKAAQFRQMGIEEGKL
ncbi:MAG: hypothetical protein NUV75_00590 [Gallionella sp.]|nr:hypothetical protein [Gallionella sp.]